jgi:hypothetical protein
LIYCPQVQNQKNPEELSKLEYDMTMWYNEYWYKHTKMPQNHVIVGGFYAAFVYEFNSWYR